MKLLNKAVSAAQNAAKAFNRVFYRFLVKTPALNSAEYLLKYKKHIIFLTIFMLFAFNLSGCATYRTPSAYSAGFISVSTPSFAFSFGQGVNAYYYPPFQTYIYGYNGYYYRWFNNSWVYASAYSGPWFQLPPTVVLPSPLLYGPPPPIVTYRPYFMWWRRNVGPWYRIYHPGWWVRHRAYLRHYDLWRSHAARFYANHPFNRWKMRRIFNIKHREREKYFRRRMKAYKRSQNNRRRFYRHRH
jgi:hypothetical protein